MTGTEGETGDTRWPIALELFQAIVELAPTARAEALAASCGGDEELRRRVEELVEADERTGEPSGLVRPASSADLLAPGKAERLIGNTIGAYRVEGVIAAGGMGVVLEARQESPTRIVALKLMAAGLASSSARRRFEYEAEVLGLLRHPNIAQVYASGTQTFDDEYGVDLPWIAMELVEGGRALLQYARQERLDLPARLRLFREVCAAVHHAHARGVIHRDLKPGNILVDAEGRPKVIDFGIARAAAPDPERTALTEEGAIVGTLQYMAPEQLRGAPIDVRTDVYALGVILYELTAGTRPHDLSDKPVPVAFRILSESTPPPPSAHREGLPREIDWIVAAAMERDPEERYGSVQALDEDVGRFLRDEPVLAGSRSGWYRMRKYVRRHRFGVGASVVIAVLALAAVSAWIVGTVKTRREHERMIRLADGRELRLLRERAEELYPPYPALVPDLRAWIRAAEELEPRLDLHREVLAELEAREDASMVLDEDAWWRETLTEVVAQFEDVFVGGEAMLDDVRARLAVAETIGERTVEGPDAARRWARAAEEVDDDDRFGGLRLAPQLGLIPLGRDPGSGLQELLVDLTGDAPARGAHGHLVPDPEAGVVLVLVPGGPVPEILLAPEGGRSPEPLSPYLVSKWELTQAQWSRMTGLDPSGTKGPIRPLENVSWDEAMLWLPRYDLELVTDEQWCLAMLGGTPGPFWLEPPADWSEYCQMGPREEHADVGGTPPNPYGLHDLLGNVEEWCRDVHPNPELRIVQGGAYFMDPAWFESYAHPNFQTGYDPGDNKSHRGIRPARALDP